MRSLFEKCRLLYIHLRVKSDYGTYLIGIYAWKTWNYYFLQFNEQFRSCMPRIIEWFQQTINVCWVYMGTFREMQTNILVHNCVEISRGTLSLWENLNQKDNLTYRQSIHAILDYFMLENELQVFQLCHDTWCNVTSDSRNHFAFFHAGNILSDEFLSLNTYHLHGNFLPILAYLVMLGYCLHYLREILRIDAWQAICEDLIKDFEELVLRSEVFES